MHKPARLQCLLLAAALDVQHQSRLVLLMHVRNVRRLCLSRKHPAVLLLRLLHGLPAVASSPIDQMPRSSRGRATRRPTRLRHLLPMNVALVPLLPISDFSLLSNCNCISLYINLTFYSIWYHDRIGTGVSLMFLSWPFSVYHFSSYQCHIRKLYV
uniref:Uncharacterized protein n=1 Tax=Arundo donax TaxID=35708 RepID=A0A0A8ZK15_ARUDO